MLATHLQRRLVPDAAPYKRTAADERRDNLFMARSKAAGLLRAAAAAPGLQAPQLVSTHSGAIERLLFTFPAYALAQPAYVAAYRSVLGALRPGTEFVVVHHEGGVAEIEGWFSGAGHAADKVTYAPLPGYVNFTDWAEDSYVSLTDAADGSHYLMEPWEFKRAGDALVADCVEGYSDISAAQAPLIFQGGNCLVTDAVWLLGKDYFMDSVGLVAGSNPPVATPVGVDPADFVMTLFSRYVDAGRRLKVVGTPRPIALRDMVGVREVNAYFLDLPSDGAGTFQPIFHIDMFITPLRAGDGGRPRVLVGDPRMADKLLDVHSPYALADIYDSIALDLEADGFEVLRNPIVHLPTVGREFSLSQLKQMGEEEGGESIAAAVLELEAAGAAPHTRVAVRGWHHVTWNNCLVEESAIHGDHVYLPTFGYGTNARLATIDRYMKALWQRLGYEVHLLGDFNPFAARLGVVHCIKKYLRRGS